MKTTVLATAAAVLAAVFSVAASAQTGAPSSKEVGATPAASPAVDVADAEVGSYARYLMLNGKTRDEAVREAQNYDHPAATRRFALRRATPSATAPATTRQ